MCCASREASQHVKQYIDKNDIELNAKEFKPKPLEEHWNSEHMKGVRKRMMNGETLPECEVCNHRILNHDVYRSYFNHLFGSHRDSILAQTAEDGTYLPLPTSFDYRFTNLCNFKCRMCGPQLSSAWTAEGVRNHNQDAIDTAYWKTVTKWFFENHVEPEFLAAIEEKRIEEIYWVGGEPLLWDIHWKSMKRIHELDLGKQIYIRYNTNLSHIFFNGNSLFGLLQDVRDWEICASIDGTGKIGEYIRTGLDYKSWRKHYQRGLESQKKPTQMRLDFTLTLPGMFDIENMVALSQETNTQLLTKLVYAFDPSIVMSPMALPREILNRLVDERLSKVDSHWMRTPLVKTLESLKTRKTFEEEWPDRYHDGLKNGKRRLLHLESIRKFEQPITMQEILGMDPQVLQWWNSI